MSNGSLDATLATQQPAPGVAVETPGAGAPGTVGGRPAPAAPSTLASRDSQLSARVEQFGLVGVLAATILLFSIWAPDTFPTLDNLRSILAGQSVLAVLAIAALIPLVVGQFDLSIAAVLGLSSLAGAALMSDASVPLFVAIVGAVAVGGLIGLINGVLVARVGVNSIITTLGTASVIAGTALWYSEGTTISTGISTDLVDFGSRRALGVPVLFLAVVVVAVLVGYLLRLTPFGRKLFATGTNERAAVLVGLPVKRLTILAFVISGLVAGLGGVLQIASTGSADPSFGPNLLLPALTAVFLGATTIRPGEYNVVGTLVAIAFLACSLSGLALVGAPAWVEPVYNGTALIVAVALSTVMRRRRAGA
jgi:ribose transport system permease protein